jgi:hypothetical protein
MKSFAQRDAQLKATEAARGAAARRAQAQRDAARAEEDRQRAEAEHVHSFSPGEYVLNYSHSVHECKCGYAVLRKVRL